MQKFRDISYKVLRYTSLHPEPFSTNEIQVETGIVGEDSLHLSSDGKISEGNTIYEENTSITALVGGGKYFALSHDGILYSFNQYETQKLKIVHELQGKIILSIAAGKEHALCETNDGVYMWGQSYYRQCCIPGTVRTPTLIPQVSSITERIKFSLGAWTSSVLTRYGLYMWGHNIDGRCGHPYAENLRVPTLVQFHEQFADVIASAYHTTALTVSGRVVTWGITIGPYGGRSEKYPPTYVSQLDGILVKRIFSTNDAQATIAITSNDKVMLWGINSNELVNDSYDAEPDVEPTELHLGNVSEIANISLHNGCYYVIYAYRKDMYSKLATINKFFDVTIFVEINSS